MDKSMGQARFNQNKNINFAENLKLNDMRLTGRRESSNVDDRRRSGGKTAGLGIGGALLIAAITYFTTGNLGQAISTGFQVVQSSGSSNEQYEPTAEENELATFTSQILAGTEDVWTEEFQKMGKTYHGHVPRFRQFRLRIGERINWTILLFGRSNRIHRLAVLHDHEVTIRHSRRFRLRLCDCP